MPRVLSVTLLILWSLTGPSPLPAADKTAGQLTVRDALGMPGKPLRIEARLAKEGLLNRMGLGGEQLELLLGEEKIGQAMTGGDGRAFFEQVCRHRGSRTMTVRLAGKARVDSPEAVGTMACWEKRRPVLLVDLAALVKPRPSGFPGPALSLPLEPSRPEPESDAAEELKRLTEYFFNVAYLNWPETEEASAGWPAWLREQHFPTGPVIEVERGPAGLEALLDRLKSEGWENVKSGIGRTKAFAETLVNRRLEVVVVPAREETWPRRARVAKDWKEVRKKLRS